MSVGGGPRKRGAEDFHPRKGGVKEKDADVIVVDASVLVNALGQLKKWCRDGQEEIIIVPLEGAVQFSWPFFYTWRCSELTLSNDPPACPLP